MRVTKNNQITFIQGGVEIPGNKEVDKIKSKIEELFNVKHVNFLLGAGASAEAVPTMKKMKKEIESELSGGNKELYEKIAGENLETKLEVLYAKKYSLERMSEQNAEEITNVENLIGEIKAFLYKKINVNISKDGKKTLEIYKKFYQKITLRNKDLSRINVFTTNSDLLNETALDDLNINYNNGFGGGLKRVFNPARFRYTFSKKIDVNLEKFEPLEDMIYLYKLHGSINWVEKDGSLFFNVHEISITPDAPKEKNAVLIYPTPLKQKQSLGSPYTDIIREFQTKLSLPNSVLFVIGYSFNDDHINNIIYQSLTSNSALSVFLFSKEETPLTQANDSRICQVFGEKDRKIIHHFEYIVTELLPDVDENRSAVLLDNFKSTMKKILDI